MIRTRSKIAAFMTGVLAVTVLAGGGAAWAGWTASAGATGSLSTPTVAITESTFGTLRATYSNLHTRLTSTGSFTLTNTGSITGTAGGALSAEGPLAAALPVRVWTAARAADCTAGASVPSAAASGTWAALSVPTVSLAAGAAQVYCVRTTVPVAQRNAMATASGAQAVTGTLTATLAAQGWTARATATAVQQTAAIYPLTGDLAPSAGSRWFWLRSAGANGVCLDVAASGAAGANVIPWGCTSGANQFWQVSPVSESDPSLVTLRPRHQPGLRLALDAAGRQTLAPVANDPAQHWWVQKAGATVQLVSAATGACLVLPASAADRAYTATDCAGASHVLTLAERAPLSVEMVTGTVADLAVGPARTSLTLQRQNGTVWTNVLALPGSDATTLRFSTTAVGAGSTAMRLVFDDGTVAYSFVLSKSGNRVTLVSGTA